MIRLLPFRTWLVFGATLLVCLLLLSWCSRGASLKNAKQEAQTANATGKALDKVAAETPVIRQDQEEKQREIDTLEGADQRLPDGFGADLQRLRDRERRNP